MQQIIRICSTLLLPLFSMLACFTASAQQPLKFVWNNYCPFTCQTSNGGPPGYAMEVVQAVFNRSPYLVDFRFVESWNRAMMLVKNGEKDAIVFSFYEPESNADYIIPTEPLAQEGGISFVVKKSNPWRFNSITDLNQLKFIGVYKNTTWADNTMALFERNNPRKFVYMHGDKIVDRAFNLVRRGRLDAWEDSEILLNYYIYSHGIEDMRVETLTKASAHLGSILFSRKNPKAKQYAAYFDNAIKRLRETGELQKILSRYGQKDWR